MVQLVIEELLDLAMECEDARARRWLFASVILLLAGNIAFIMFAVALLDMRLAPAAAALVGSFVLLMATGLSLVRALWIVSRQGKASLPPAWKWWALLALVVIVALPAPLALMLAIVLAWRLYLRRPSSAGGLPRR